MNLIDSLDPTKAAFYTNPALYASAVGGAAGFLLLTSALHRGSVTTAVAGMVVGETVLPAIIGVVWLGDQTRDGLGWMVAAGLGSPSRRRWCWPGSAKRPVRKRFRLPGQLWYRVRSTR